MRNIINKLDMVPGSVCSSGAMNFIHESDLNNQKLFCRFSKRQDTALSNLVEKLQNSIDNDYWPCKVGDQCEWCPFNYVCTMDREDDSEYF